jgi:hypothetical protein
MSGLQWILAVWFGISLLTIVTLYIVEWWWTRSIDREWKRLNR